MGKKEGKLTMRPHEMALEGVEVVGFSPPDYEMHGTPTTPERSNTDSNDGPLVKKKSPVN